MPLSKAIRALHDHRYSEKAKLPKEEIPEIDRELMLVKSLIESALKAEELDTEELKVLFFQQQISAKQAHFINPNAVEIIQLSCKESEVPINIRVARSSLR